jgi:hypothetical protein
MALHGKVWAHDEGLILAPSAAQNPRGTGRERESFAMPVEGLEAFQIAQPLADGRIGRLDRAPTEFLDSVFRDDATERLADELSAETMADHGNIRRDRASNQIEHRRQPQQIVVDAHRPAHETQARIVSERSWRRVTGIDADQLPGNVVGVEESGKIAGTFPGTVTKDGNGLHVRQNEK